MIMISKNCLRGWMKSVNRLLVRQCLFFTYLVKAYEIGIVVHYIYNKEAYLI